MVCRPRCCQSQAWPRLQRERRGHGRLQRAVVAAAASSANGCHAQTGQTTPATSPAPGATACGSGVSGLCPALLSLPGGGPGCFSGSLLLRGPRSAERRGWARGPAPSAAAAAEYTASGLGGTCSPATAWNAVSSLPGPCGEPLPALPQRWCAAGTGERHSASRRAAELAASAPRMRHSALGLRQDAARDDLAAVLAGVADRLPAPLPSGDAGPSGRSADRCSRSAREHQCAARSAATSASRYRGQGRQVQGEVGRHVAGRPSAAVGQGPRQPQHTRSPERWWPG